MIYYILLTAFTVSIDSFICGFSLVLKNCNKLLVIFGITFTVFFMCLLANYLPLLFEHSLTNTTPILGGIILIAVGIFNLFKKDENMNFSGDFKLVFLSGFAVGIDGAVANLSLSIMGINSFFVPVIFGIMHGLTIALSVVLSSFIIIKKGKFLSFLPSFLLIILGLYKCFYSLS